MEESLKKLVVTQDRLRDSIHKQVCFHSFMNFPYFLLWETYFWFIFQVQKFVAHNEKISPIPGLVSVLLSILRTDLWKREIVCTAGLSLSFMMENLARGNDDGAVAEQVSFTRFYNYFIILSFRLFLFICEGNCSPKFSINKIYLGY